MSTASWTGVLQIIRNRLLTFTPTGGGTTLATRLGSTSTGSGSDGKLFIDQAPDTVTGLWAVLHVIDAPESGFDGGFLIRAQVELMIYGRPRSSQATVKSCADVVAEAWHAFYYSEAGGHVSGTGVLNRSTIPYTSDPADRDLVAVRLVLGVRCTPIFLTRYASA
jgi:hypothetical protein